MIELDIYYTVDLFIFIHIWTAILGCLSHSGDLLLLLSVRRRVTGCSM